jgi:V/A-type H+-transporting ATPase subunit E
MNESRVDVLLSPQDRDTVGAIVLEKYRDLVSQGLTLRPDERVDAGFKVSFVDYHLYHDFTAEALAEALAPVLKPPLCDIVRRATAERA